MRNALGTKHGDFGFASGADIDRDGVVTKRIWILFSVICRKGCSTSNGFISVLSLCLGLSGPYMFEGV